MALAQQLDDTLKGAIKEKDSRTANVVRMLKTRLTERTTAKGFTGWVQSPISPQDSGTAIQRPSQMTVGTMFSATSWLPPSPHATSAASTSTLSAPGSGWSRPTTGMPRPTSPPGS